MKKLILISALIIGLSSCENRDKTMQDLNTIINDTITLSDGHVYYKKDEYNGEIPIHSQYCKNH